MASVQAVLHQNPWIPYNDTFFHSRMVLTYPQNMIFATQLLHDVQSLDVYKQFPSAERFNPQRFQDVDWQNSMIVFDDASRVVLAPEPVVELIQMDRRLHYREAFQTVFGPFRILPIALFRFQWFWIWSLILGWIITRFSLNVVKRMPYRLVLTSKLSKNRNRP